LSNSINTSVLTCSIVNSFAYNGILRDDEIQGVGNSYTAEFWQMDPRLGRRWNLDPKYLAGESRYSTFSNNPIIYVDPLGDFRTKFGANVYKFFHGGEVGKNDKGQ
jgi:RHS repeat-associated protein